MASPLSADAPACTRAFAEETSPKAAASPLSADAPAFTPAFAEETAGAWEAPEAATSPLSPEATAFTPTCAEADKEMAAGADVTWYEALAWDAATEQQVPGALQAALWCTEETSDSETVELAPAERDPPATAPAWGRAVERLREEMKRRGLRKEQAVEQQKATGELMEGQAPGAPSTPSTARAAAPSAALPTEPTVEVHVDPEPLLSAMQEAFFDGEENRALTELLTSTRARLLHLQLQEQPRAVFQLGSDVDYMPFRVKPVQAEELAALLERLGLSAGATGCAVVGPHKAVVERTAAGDVASVTLHVGRVAKNSSLLCAELWRRGASLLITGASGSGKTAMLRDAAVQLSRRQHVVVLDSGLFGSAATLPPNSGRVVRVMLEPGADLRKAALRAISMFSPRVLVADCEEMSEALEVARLCQEAEIHLLAAARGKFTSVVTLIAANPALAECSPFDSIFELTGQGNFNEGRAFYDAQAAVTSWRAGQQVVCEMRQRDPHTGAIQAFPQTISRSPMRPAPALQQLSMPNGAVPAVSQETAWNERWQERSERVDRPQDPRRLPVEQVGVNVTVRKHSSMGCAVVSFADPRVRQAVVAQGDQATINGVKVQIVPHQDKDTGLEVETDLFVAWGRQVEKTTPLSDHEIVRFFDQRCVEARAMMPAPPVDLQRSALLRRLVQLIEENGGKLHMGSGWGRLRSRYPREVAELGGMKVKEWLAQYPSVVQVITEGTASDFIVLVKMAKP